MNDLGALAVICFVVGVILVGRFFVEWWAKKSASKSLRVRVERRLALMEVRDGVRQVRLDTLGMLGMAEMDRNRRVAEGRETYPITEELNRLEAKDLMEFGHMPNITVDESAQTRAPEDVPGTVEWVEDRKAGRRTRPRLTGKRQIELE